MSTQSQHNDNPQLFMGRLVSRGLFTLFFMRCKVFGQENIPRKGPAYILALNHASLIDPPLVWAFYPDPVYFLAKQELHDFPIFGWGCSRAGVIPIRRGALDLRAIRTCIRYLTELHRNLAIFVEGTRSDDGQLGQGKLGCALLSAKSRAAVVPAYVYGSYNVLPRSGIVPRFSNKLELHIGKPLELSFQSDRPSRPELEAATGTILAAIEKLNPNCSPEPTVSGINPI